MIVFLSIGETRRRLSEPCFDIAQLAHVELLTPDMDGSLSLL